MLVVKWKVVVNKTPNVSRLQIVIMSANDIYLARPLDFISNVYSYECKSSRDTG